MNREQLLQTFVLANEFKEGDLLVGGTRDQKTRREAQEALASLRLGELSKTSLVEDAVTEALAHSLDSQLANALSLLSVAKVKRVLLDADVAAWARQYCNGLSSEAIAAVVKLMTNDELASVSRALFSPLRRIPSPCRPSSPTWPAAAQDSWGPAGDRGTDPRLRPLERAVLGPPPGLTGKAGPGRTPAAPAEVALIVPMRLLGAYSLEGLGLPVDARHRRLVPMPLVIVAASKGRAARG